MLHPPHGNRPPAVFLPTVPDLIIPAYPFVPVEDDEMALAHIAAAVHIPHCLLQAFSDGLVQIATLDFQFQHNAMYGAAVTQESAFSRKNCRKSDSNFSILMLLSGFMYHADCWISPL